MHSIRSAGRAVNASARPRKLLPQAQRDYKLLLAPTPTMPGFLRITMATGCRVRITDYFISRIVTPLGAGYRLVNVLSEHDGYDAQLRPDGLFSCERMGHFWHGTICKRVATIQDLRREGKL
jgi:hypothetical protein